MSNSLNPVFGQWYTDKQLGNGTDGKVFAIYKENYDGSRDNSVLKIIRLGENRNERKLFGSENITADTEEEYYDNIVNNILNNIKEVKSSDNGKFFIKYEDVELRKASDGKGRLILIKLEQGKSLTELLKEFSFTLDESLRLGINVCKSLCKCRTFGYIYPNLKPENILFDVDGRCKLGDFGTFSYLEPAKSSVAFKRTQYYMAPEFIRTGNINCTADTYSLGLILYMLTNRGRLPFTEPYPEIVTVNSLNNSVEKRLAGEDMPKPAFASDDLWRIIRKACAYDPNKRYFSPEQMLSDLKNALANKPFEEPKYDEVYSKSNENGEEDVIIPDVEVSFQKPEDVTPSLSIKEEIQIPEITSPYKTKKTARKKVFKYEKLPEIKKPVKKANNDGLKKLLVLAIIALALVMLFILSAILYKDESSKEVLAGVINNFVFELNSYGGVIHLGCPNG